MNKDSLKIEEYSQRYEQRHQREGVANHHQVEMSHGHLQQEDAALRRRWSGPAPGSAGVPLTVWWLVLLALQLVKLVHVLLLSGWRPHSPFSAHTLDATAGNTCEGHEVKVGLGGPGASLANVSRAEKLRKHLV